MIGSITQDIFSGILNEMKCLNSTPPDIWAYLKKGGFSVQLGRSNTFGKIPVDQTTEVAASKDTQTSGGTKRFSLNVGAVSHY